VCDLDVLPEDEALDLLRTILSEGGRDDIVGATHASPLRRLAELCGRLPLALRIAAGYLTTYADRTLDEYLEALERERIKHLAVKGAGQVAAVLGLSVERLARDDPELARRWYELAVFSAPFDREAAAAVWDLPEEETREALSELCRRSLLDHDRAARTYSLHELLREYALTSHPTADAARARHAHHYLARGRQADELYRKGGEHALEALRRFDVLWPHLQAAWEWMASRDDLDALHFLSDLPGAMPYLLDLRLTPSQRIPILKAALEAARRLEDRRAEGVHLGNLGLAYAALGDARRAIEYYEQALAIHRQIGDRRGEGAWLGNLGLAYADLGDMRRAIQYHEQALAISQQIGDRRGEGNDLGNLGLAYAALGDVRQATQYYERALVIARGIGDQRMEGSALGNLGLAYANLGDMRRAIQYHEQALVIAREIGDRRMEGSALGNLGLMYTDLGDVRCAIEYYQQALAISREIGDRRGEGNRLGNLGAAYHRLEEYRDAIELYEQALNIAREIGDRRGEGNRLGNLGLVYADLGDVRQAIRCYQQALKIAREIGDRQGEGIHIANLGRAYASLGDKAQARELWEEALRTFEEIESPEAERVRRWLAEL